VGVDSSGFIPLPIYGQEYNTRTGPMEDQPSSILNVILGWDYKGFSARVSYRYQSHTVESLDARYSIFDSYYDTFSLVDLMLKQKITKNISCYANLTNIGNHVDDYYFGEQGEDKPALPTNSQFYGFRAQLGVKIDL
jgi:outer membrane receptor for ferrienterochelin and colicin